MNMMAPLAVVEPVLTRAEVASLVALAARQVPPLWPLESAIAVNPLAGFEQFGFNQAVDAAAKQFGARSSLPLAAWRAVLDRGQIDSAVLREAAVHHLGGIDEAFRLIGPDLSRLDLVMHRLRHEPSGRHFQPDDALPATSRLIAKWCAAFFDQGQAAFALPHAELGLYRASLAGLAHDPEFRALAGQAGADLLLTVPRDPLEAIAEGLAALDVAPSMEETKLARLVTALPGWAGHLRWRSEHADADVAAGAPASMADLLALLLLMERACGEATRTAGRPTGLLPEQLAAQMGLDDATVARLSPSGHAALAQVAGFSHDQLGRIFQTAAEWTYRGALAPQLQAAIGQCGNPEPADAQLIFCIDVRSEPFRRALEQTGRYDTYGYAGFFGLPIALHQHGEARRKRLLPVLLAPQHDLAEAITPGREAEAASRIRREQQLTVSKTSFTVTKQGASTAFALAEATGPWAGAIMALRTLAPRLVKRLGKAFLPPREDIFSPGHCAQTGDSQPFTLDEKIGFALALFKLTGLATPTARLVVLVGHGGSAVNNPYAAALDCGACGGHSGGANARVLAGILNDQDVRAGLCAHGVQIAADTVFVAAQHNTTTDAVTLFDTQTVPASHQPDLAALRASLVRAGNHNRSRRAAALGRSADDLLTGASHWGEIRPEWGLASNAGFIVGPRSWTREIDLGGRAFLHSYDWQSDADGTALTTILTAPMVVAQWINCQYLFSTVDNDRFGSGDKTTQNPVGRIGVLQGNDGDLRVGLPRQSLFRDDGTPHHVPQRLACFILAPVDRVERIVTANAILSRLFGNGWVSLIVIDPQTAKVRRWRRDDELAVTPTAQQEPQP